MHAQAGVPPGALNKTFQNKVKPNFQSAFKTLQIGWRRARKRGRVTGSISCGIYPPSDVCGRMWWSVWGWACLWGSASAESRRWVWDSRTLGGSDNDGASLAPSAGYSCISALSWTPSLLHDWQLQWKILSTSLSTFGESGQSRVTCSHTRTRTIVLR